MRFQQISQRGKEYLKTAATLLRAAQTMTDRAIAGQLKALAAELRKPRMLMRPKHSLDRLQTLMASGGHDLMGSITAELAKKCVVNVGMPARWLYCGDEDMDYDVFFDRALDQLRDERRYRAGARGAYGLASRNLESIAFQSAVEYLRFGNPDVPS